ncbi:MAG TPA: CheR family methyltransferase [Polyangia bacterium]|jgi:chemotaxis protein methyltransferase CheR
MRDHECDDFLQWCLPRLELRWPGFRKFQRQVCRRVQRRIDGLGLPGFAAYREHLLRHAEEWPVLDALCRVVISRFGRDRGVFEALRAEVLPALIAAARAGGGREVRCWSAGCASGEEPYTLALLWSRSVRGLHPDVDLRIVATDADERLLARARQGGGYPRGSLKDLPPAWAAEAFEERDGLCYLRAPVRAAVELVQQDVRAAVPAGPFHLVLCRNLAFTYFDEPLQRAVLGRIAGVLLDGGALVIGAHERLPDGAADFVAWPPGPGIYRKGLWRKGPWRHGHWRNGRG